MFARIPTSWQTDRYTAGGADDWKDKADTRLSTAKRDPVFRTGNQPTAQYFFFFFVFVQL